MKYVLVAQQIGLGNKYLKSTLGFSFPEVQARAAAAADAQRDRQVLPLNQEARFSVL